MTPLAASTFVWVFILLPLVVVWAVGLVDIVRRPLSRQAKAGWIVVVLLLPFVGTILYWILRKPTEEEIRRAQRSAADRRHGDPRAGQGPHPPID
jgi:hypothetical protein